MTIHLPQNLESSILAAVHCGRFASLDEAMAAAANLLVQRLEQEQAQAKPSAADRPHDPLLGAWREDADLLDEIVEHAMKVREERPWRLAPGE
jgi:Arc/MetJ-type ribon-helix-helix transcriptional regulator